MLNNFQPEDATINWSVEEADMTVEPLTVTEHKIIIA